MRMISCPGIKLLFLTFLICPGAFAQTSDKDWVDGKLYVQVVPGLSESFPEFNGPKERASTDWGIFKDIEPLVEQYGVFRIKRAFKTRSPELDRIYLMELNAVGQEAKLLNEIERLPLINYAEREPVYYTTATPNDFDIFDLYHLRVIRAEEAWDITQGSPDVTIAIIDDAMDIDHEDLRDNVWTNPNEIPGNGIDDDNNGFIDDVNGYDVASNDNNPRPITPNISHGTNVGSCAAASTNNGVGIAGIGYNCSLIPVKASNQNLLITNSFEGIDYAISAPADIVNMSFGGSQFNRTIQTLILEGASRGIIFVGAAGNDNSGDPFYPASYDKVINVGFTNSLDVKAPNSNFGDIDIVAPGQSIWVTSPFENRDDFYVQNSGSSFASPIVAGIVGLMKSVHPCLNADNAEEILKRTAVNIDAQNPDFVGLLGAGRADAAAAVAASIIQIPDAGFEIARSIVCGGKVELSADFDSRLFGCNFSWTIEGTNGFQASYSGTEIEAVVPESGNYTISLTVSNSLGSNEAISQTEITLLEEPEVDLGPDLSACWGDELILQSNVTGVSTFFWSPEVNLENPNSLSPNLIARNTARYILTVVASNRCSAADTLLLDVVPQPTTVAVGGGTIQAGDSIRLTALGASNFEWSPAGSLNDPNIPNPLAFPSQTTTYQVKGFNSQGCFSQDSVTVIVDQSTAITVDQFTSFKAFPNPASRSITLEAKLESPSRLRIRLVSLLGQEIIIHDGQVGNSFTKIWERPENIPSGNYSLLWEVNEKLYSEPLQLW